MKVALVAAVTLDGKIAQSSGQTSLDWTSKEDTQFFVQKTKEAGVMIMGRSTYETIGKPLPGRLMFVMSSQADGYENIPGQVEWVSGSPQEVLEMVKGRGYDSVVIAGGSNIYSQFLSAGLVTDLFLTYEPIVFGSGVSLVQNIDPKKCTFVESRQLGTSAVLLHYRV